MSRLAAATLHTRACRLLLQATLPLETVQAAPVVSASATVGVVVAVRDTVAQPQSPTGVGSAELVLAPCQ